MSEKSKINISERKILLRILDIVAAMGGLVIVSMLYDFQYFNFSDYRSTSWGITLAVYILFFGEVFEMYDLRKAESRFQILRSVFFTSILTTIFFIFTPIIAPSLPENRLQIFYLFLALIIPIIIWRFIYITFIFSPKFYKNILLIGNNKTLEFIIPKILEKSSEAKIAGYISDRELSLKNGKIYKVRDNELIRFFNDNHISEVVVCSNNASKKVISGINNQIIQLFEDGVNIKSFENFYEEITFRVSDSQLNEHFYNHLAFSKNHENRFYLTTIRIIDIVVAFLGILFLIFISPLLLLGNIIGNKGSFFYKQKRVGKGGDEFDIIKLRSMIMNAEENGAVWATTNDVRVTSFGKFLRKTRLDEIPQFINVLKGEMSLIGPRPERPEFVLELSKKIPFYAIRNVVKPGLSGWAQVMFPYAKSIEDQGIKLRYDLYYIKKRGFFLDFKIFIKTISTVLFFRGH